MRRLWFCLALAACASSAPEEEQVPPPPPAPELPPPTPREETVPSRPTLSDVMRYVDTVPLLEAARESIAREQGSVVQAGLAPNPSVRVVGDRLSVDDFSDGFGRRQIQLRERFETGGKRSARKQASQWRVHEAHAGAQMERFQVAGAAAVAHQDALAAQRLVGIREEMLTAADDLLALQRQRVKSGRDRESTLLPLQTRAALLGVALVEEQGRARAALRRLEGILALESGTLEGVSGDLLSEAALVSADEESLLEDNPELEARKAAEDAARSRIRHARSLASPDVTVGVGYEDRTESVDDPGKNLGFFVEIPLNVIDRNQGGILEAEAEVRRMQALTRDRSVKLTARYAEILELLAALRTNRDLYRDEIVPARTLDLRAAEAGHGAGRYDRIEVLERRLRLLVTRAELLLIETELSARIVDAFMLVGREIERWES